MTDQLAPPPPPVVAPKRKFPWWILGCCCSGCLLMFLVAVGTPLLIISSAYNRFNEGRSEEVQKTVVDSIIPSTGPPPGFRVYSAMSLPWPLDSRRGALYVPENAQGDLETILSSSDTLAILMQIPDSEREKARRDRIFRDGQLGPPPEVSWIFDRTGTDWADRNANKIEKGTLLGHRFPLPYFILNETDESQPNEKPRRGRRGDRTGGFAGVDLTPSGVTDRATLLWVIRKTSNPITPSFLEDFCKNFRPGE